LAAYRYTDYKSSDSPAPALKEVIICSRTLDESRAKKELASARILAEATIFSRDLVNCPPSDLQPKDLVLAAKKLAKKGSPLTVSVQNKAALKKLGANALLAVSLGSAAEPFMITLRYRPKKLSKNARRIVLVGKGVTYDSGGLSIKGRKGLEAMKCDMAGAAAVLGVMKAIADLPASARPRNEIIAIIPTTENMISGKAVKPGDVVKAVNGKTIEILNTDAEGRLILADALAYSKKFKADITIDAATLTGACMAALGSNIAGLFSADDDLVEELLSCSDVTGEKLWRLPMDESYRRHIDSPVADIKNIGSAGPGATTAALILREFVPSETRWAHIDIAGPAFVSAGGDYHARGATGYGVRTLLKFAQSA
jgi:leucyl aminopeptidase